MFLCLNYILFVKAQMFFLPLIFFLPFVIRKGYTRLNKAIDNIPEGGGIRMLHSILLKSTHQVGQDGRISSLS
jgi:hypothetical protein